MFDIGFSELLLVGVIALIVLGPERLPKAARSVGMFFGKIRRMLSNIQQEMEQEIRNQELQEKLKNPLATFGEESLQKKPAEPVKPAEPAQPTAETAPQAAVITPAAESLNTAASVASPISVKSDK
ncbi:MAG: twin-arginine translocase subunit TatB [Oceanospirillaceae bacterium]|nr:twin-arginine translocase subunit TatB [Oceanospirillaceae bacterium]